MRRGALRERRLADRHLSEAGRPELDAWFVEHHGATVLRGPMAGLWYPPFVHRYVHHLTAKLLGAYEEELHAVLTEQLARTPPAFVDLGAADGYYAAGVALASTGTRVHAYEIDPVARNALKGLAAANGVSERVTLHRAANARRLAEHELDAALVLCDVEGAELDVLDGPAVGALAAATMIVELHEAAEADVEAVLRERFASTHTAAVIESRSREPSAYAELDGAPHRETAVDEFRTDGYRWLVLKPR
jgi:predicted RNA methylase